MQKLRKGITEAQVEDRARKGGQAFVVDIQSVPDPKKPSKPRGVAFTVGLDDDAEVDLANLQYEKFFKRIQPEEQKTAETEYEDDFNEVMQEAAKDFADLEEDRVEEEDEPLVTADDPQKPERSALR